MSTLTIIQQRLFEFEDAKNAAFQQRLIPTANPNCFIGVRAPELRNLAKEFNGTLEAEAFLAMLPHTYFDEYCLHGALLCLIKDFDTCIAAVDKFLPFVDNWATCDSLSPKIFKKQPLRLLPHIQRWIASPETYTCRFGIEMLMSFFLDANFQAEYLEWVASLKSEEYYVKMMIAWFFATALAKQWNATLPYVQQPRMDVWTHNKAIQKACESYRITTEQKELLRTLKLKNK